MRPARVSCFGSAVLAAGLLAAGACGPGTPPVGQPPMTLLTDQTLEALREQFNQASKRTRIVLLLSPT